MCVGPRPLAYRGRCPPPSRRRPGSACSFPPPPIPIPPRPEPAWATGHPELQRKGVPVFLLWQEDKSTPPEGLQYSRFWQGYRAWTGKLDLGMRQSHRAGEKLLVDYAGQGIPGGNPHSGEGPAGAMFVAVLGASHDPDAEAPWPQSLPDWIGSHVRTFVALGGGPAVVVPDNLQAAVPRAHRYEPESNRTYAALAQHEGFASIPARAAKPRDKAKVEVGGQGVERWLLARLRHHTCFALAEVKAAIHPLGPALNARPCKTLPGSRQPRFEPIERPVRRPLPAQPYA